MRILPSGFDVIVTTIEETKDLSKFTVDELHESLMTHEQRLGRLVTHLWSMPSRPRCILEEEEVKAEEEEETEVKTKEEETTLHIHMEGEAIRIKATAKATASKVDTIMLMDKGMKNLMSNVIIAKNMGTMPMSVGKRKMT